MGKGHGAAGGFEKVVGHVLSLLGIGHAAGLRRDATPMKPASRMQVRI
jgi:hypothetical protein